MSARGTSPPLGTPHVWQFAARGSSIAAGRRDKLLRLLRCLGRGSGALDPAAPAAPPAAPPVVPPRAGIIGVQDTPTFQFDANHARFRGRGRRDCCSRFVRRSRRFDRLGCGRCRLRHGSRRYRLRRGCPACGSAAVGSGVRGSSGRSRALRESISTTRRLAARPSSLSLPATGWNSPYPMAARRVGPTPNSVSSFTMVAARAEDNSQFDG